MSSKIIAQSEQLLGRSIDACIALGSHASKRQYFRLHCGNDTVIAVENEDVAENKAFIAFARHFHRAGVAVPEVLAVSDSETFYLIEDLGDCTLYEMLVEKRGDGDQFPEELIPLYRAAITELATIQTIASKGIDYSFCHTGQEFDVGGMRYDMNAFQKELLDRVGVIYEAEALQKDFDRFVEFLSQTPRDYFMYRDFQARNIMIHNDHLYFIDFQGGRRGPLQYDVISLLYQSQARLPESLRQELLSSYLDALEDLKVLNREEFLQFYDGFVFLRIMQVLGVYGRAGLGEKKEYFLTAIPLAIANMTELIEAGRLPVVVPEFSRVVKQLASYNKETQHV